MLCRPFVTHAADLTMDNLLHLQIIRETTHLQRPWTGASCYFERGCDNIDDHINRIASVHDVQMKQLKRVCFDEANIHMLEVQPYS